MLTNNFYTIQKLAMLVNNGLDSDSNDYTRSRLLNVFGIAPVLMEGTDGYVPTLPFKPLTRVGGGTEGVHIFLGSGTDPESPGDTDLAERFDSSVISQIDVNTISSWSSGDHTLTYILTAENVSGDTVTVSEVGAGVSDGGSGGLLNGTCLIMRHVLPQAVTVPPGSSFAVTVSFTVNRTV